MSQKEDQLYVRVDGYKVLLQDLEAVRQIVQNINEASEVLRQVRDVKEKTIDTIYENLDRMNDKLEDIHMEMPEVDAVARTEAAATVDIDTEEHETRSEIDESVEELHSELESLQDELSNLGEEEQP